MFGQSQPYTEAVVCQGNTRQGLINKVPLLRAFTDLQVK